MSTVATAPFLLHHHGRCNLLRHRRPYRKPEGQLLTKKPPRFQLNYTQTSKSRFNGAYFCSNHFDPAQALSPSGAAVVETSESSITTFTETFQLKRPEKMEGKISIKLDKGKSEDYWQLIVGCSLPGKWVLHWGVSYIGDVGSEWDQPPLDMRPPGSISIKDYAIETPLEISPASTGGETFYEVKIDVNTNSSIAAINFVLKDEESGYWYQHKGRDFKVPLLDDLQDDRNVVGTKKSLGIWPVLYVISFILLLYVFCEFVVSF